MNNHSNITHKFLVWSSCLLCFGGGYQRGVYLLTAGSGYEVLRDHLADLLRTWRRLLPGGEGSSRGEHGLRPHVAGHGGLMVDNC